MRKKGAPLRNGSGKGTRANRGRGGCTVTRVTNKPRPRRGR